jgi:hypothetical protein
VNKQTSSSDAPLTKNNDDPRLAFIYQEAVRGHGQQLAGHPADALQLSLGLLLLVILALFFSISSA